MDLQQQLTPHFKLVEFVKSPTADRLGIDNTPPPEAVEAIKLVVGRVLEPVRERFGPTHVNSGYRCHDLNNAVGSKDTSQHRKGQAVDFECPPHSNADVAAWIRDNLDFDQLILEFYTPGDPLSGWVHASYVPTGNRKQVLTITKAGTLEGLHP